MGTTDSSDEFICYKSFSKFIHYKSSFSSSMGRYHMYNKAAMCIKMACKETMMTPA
jgi:hypothetical protein